ERNNHRRQKDQRIDLSQRHMCKGVNAQNTSRQAAQSATVNSHRHRHLPKLAPMLVFWLGEENQYRRKQDIEEADLKNTNIRTQCFDSRISKSEGCIGAEAKENALVHGNTQQLAKRRQLQR